MHTSNKLLNHPHKHQTHSNIHALEHTSNTILNHLYIRTHIKHITQSSIHQTPYSIILKLEHTTNTLLNHLYSRTHIKHIISCIPIHRTSEPQTQSSWELTDKTRNMESGHSNNKQTISSCNRHSNNILTTCRQNLTVTDILTSRQYLAAMDILTCRQNLAQETCLAMGPQILLFVSTARVGSGHTLYEKS